MNGRGKAVRCLSGSLLLMACGVVPAVGADPDHPIITEVYNNPPGAADAPVGRDPTNQNQEFIEIWLPTETGLAAGLTASGLNLTFYEVEGDRTSSGNTLVNYRFDLPTFCVLNNQAMCPGGTIPRPSSGVVVLGWLDYASGTTQGTCSITAAPCTIYLDDCPDVGMNSQKCVAPTPTALEGSPTTRVALIEGGISATDGSYVFIAMNGNHAAGGTNMAGANIYPVLAENLIDMAGETSSGIVQNGSGAYLLVNRDAITGYVELCDDQHAVDCTAGADPDLPSSTLGLTPAALLDAFAANDGSLFIVTSQPNAAPGTCAGNPAVGTLDLDCTLPIGGAFSNLTAQVPEDDATGPDPGIADGYARVYIDQAKTTETAAPDNPATDAQNAYRHVRSGGPFAPTPGRIVRSTSDPELGISFTGGINVLSGTTYDSTFSVANVGGLTPIDIAATNVGTPTPPGIATATPGAGAAGVSGRAPADASLTVSAVDGALDGAETQMAVTVTATASPPTTITNGVQTKTLTVRAFNPAEGLDANGVAFETTVYLAIQGVPRSASINEFLDTDLGAYLAANLGTSAFDSTTRAHGAALINPATNMEDRLDVHNNVTLGIENFPVDCCSFIDSAGSIPAHDLYQTVVNSAEFTRLEGNPPVATTTYVQSVSAGGAACGCNPAPGIMGVDFRFNTPAIPNPDILTFGGPFSPSESVFFAGAGGEINKISTAILNNVTTTRTFEAVIIDTNVRNNPNSTIESGSTDDFGVLVRVQDVEVWSPFADNDWVFLSFSGGFEGADIESVDLRANSQTDPNVNVLTLIYLDLDNLHDVLGIRSISRVSVIDSSNGGSQLDILEMFNLNPTSAQCTSNPQCDDGNPCTTDTCSGGTCVSTNNSLPCSDGNPCTTSTCAGGACVSSNNSLPCSDGNACTVNDTCSAGVCVPGGPLSCDDGELCTADFCDPAIGCTHSNNVAPCFDGDLCTVGDVCAGGTCQAGTLIDCTALDDACAVGTCNPATGTCFQDIGPLIGAVCRPAAGLCDVPEVCVGDLTCPVDLFQAANTLCRPSAGECDIEDVCDGLGAVCPSVCADTATLCDNGGGPGSSTCDGNCTCIGLDPPCVTAADCADLDVNGITDDVCVWWECVAGTCTSVAKVKPSDLGGAFGACATDAFCNLADALHALTCFASTNTCDEINIDAGGAFGSCVADGFCNLADALHALTCFAGTNPCACGGPSPEMGPSVVGEATLSAVPTARVVKPGGEIEVRVFVTPQSVVDFRAYQLEMAVSGGRQGSLELVDIAIEDRSDSAFANEAGVFEAFNVQNAQMLSGMFEGSVAASRRGYLATFTYRASDDAVGAFVVDVLHGDASQTMLVGTEQTDKIEVSATRPAVIVVTAASARSIR